MPTSSFVEFRIRASLDPSNIHAVDHAYAAKYVPIGYRTPSPEEIITRRMARDLKIPTEEAILTAAPLMASLIEGPCWLVPVPASNGSLNSNMVLAGTGTSQH